MATLFSDMLLCVINTGIMNNSVFLVMDYYNGHQILPFINIISPLAIHKTHANKYDLFYS